MSKSDEVLKLLVKAGSAGVSKSDLSEKLDLTDSAIYSHVHRLNKDGNKVTNDDSRYYCVKTAMSSGVLDAAPEETEGPTVGPTEKPTVELPQEKERTYLYDKVADMITQAGNKGISAPEMATVLKTKVDRIFGFVHTLREKGYKIRLNGVQYIMVNAPNQKDERRSMVRTQMNRMGASPVGAESLSEVADKLINSGKVHKKLLSLGTPVGAGSNLTAQQQEYLDMIQKSTFYALCAEALVQSAQHTHNIQKEVSGEE